MGLAVPCCDFDPPHLSPPSVQGVYRSQREALCPSDWGLPQRRGLMCPVSSPGLALCAEVQELLEGCELPDLPSSLLLPEDTALRNLPPLRAAHRRFSFDTARLLLSTLEEVRLSLSVPQALSLKTW